MAPLPLNYNNIFIPITFLHNNNMWIGYLPTVYILLLRILCICRL